MHKVRMWALWATSWFLSCSGPAALTGAPSGVQGASFDEAAWASAYSAVIGTSSAKALLQSMSASSADISGIARRSQFNALTIGAYSFVGLKATVLHPQAAAPFATLGAYWRSIDFDPSQQLSAAEFHSALATVARLFPQNGLSPSRLTGLSAPEAAALMKSNEQAIAKVWVVGIVALSTREASSVELQDNLPSGTTVVARVANPDLWRLIGQGTDKTGSLAALNGIQLTAMTDAAQTNNQQFYIYNSSDPHTLERYGTSAQSPAPAVTFNGPVNVAPGGQICTNGNCDAATGNGSIHYPNSAPQPAPASRP